MNQATAGARDGDGAEVRPVQFSYRNIAYVVELDAAGAAEFDAAIAPYIAAARRVGGSHSPQQ